MNGAVGEVNREAEKQKKRRKIQERLNANKGWGRDLKQQMIKET